MEKASLKATAAILATFVFTALVISAQTQKRTTPPPDIKIRQRMTTGSNPGMETILYIKGERMRSEMSANMAMTTILQCDLKRTLTLNEKTKTYIITPTEGTNTSNVAADGDGGGVVSTSNRQPQNQEARGGIVNITNTINDTGERKEMFGFTARRIKTSIVKTTSPDACDKDMKIETDGWYIDFQYAFECPGQTKKHQPLPVQPRPGCKDEIRTKTVGTAKLGFPLLVTTTIYRPDGRNNSMTQEVLELSREPLNASLFDVPEGYTLAKDMQELYGVNASGTFATKSQPGSNTTSASSAIGSAATTSNTTATTNASSPKKPGVIRIGLILPTVQMSQGNAAQAAEAIRNSFASYLQGPSLEVIPLSARLPSLALEEARQSQCDYVLSASMTVKKGGGGSMFGRAIGNVAGSAAGHIPGGGSATTGAARSAAITGVYATAAIANSIKARDEVTLEYKLEPTDATRQGMSNTVKAKASSDGEDIVTPLIAKAAEAVVAAVPKTR